MDLRYVKSINVQSHKRLFPCSSIKLAMSEEVIFFRMMNHERMSKEGDLKECKTPNKSSPSVFGISLLTLSAHNKVLWYQGVYDI